MVESILAQMDISSLPIYGHMESSVLWATGRNSFFLSRDILHSSVQVIITTYDGVLAIDGQPCLQYTLAHSKFLSSLQPHPDTQRQVQQFIHDYFGGDDDEVTTILMVGVHVRMHDELQDWAVVPPLMGDDEAKGFGQGSSLAHFADTMAAIRDKFTYTDGEGATRHAVRFFVASNQESCKTALLDTFPGQALSISGDYRRDSSDGIQFALLEWLILAGIVEYCWVWVL